MVEVINFMSNQNHVTLTITKANRSCLQRFADSEGVSLSQYLSRLVSCFAEVKSGLVREDGECPLYHIFCDVE